MAIEFNVFLGEHLIGTTSFEHADPTMGVVYGTINFLESSFNYDFWVNYCRQNSIELLANEPDDRLVSTANIDKLLAVNPNSGERLNPLSNQITGMDSDEFEITLMGIDSDQYERTFPEHMKEYEERFK
ncbi:MAG: hypothetical protein RIC30_10285 [Marinoscillum sp.]|uniref:hypothetical protein n=1 Tax=Marinoscillum sp. TaxID=2024838 RepID=UPI0032FF0E06